jgi:siroheme synthase-like protein
MKSQEFLKPRLTFAHLSIHRDNGFRIPRSTRRRLLNSRLANSQQTCPRCRRRRGKSFSPQGYLPHSAHEKSQVAAGRILNVLNADAKVTVVSPLSGLNPEVLYRVQQKQVTHVDRKFEPSDLDNVDMVLTAVDDPVASTQIWKLCKERRIAANIADVPPECDFYFGSVHRDGPLQIMVSTNGKGPRLANIVRRGIADKLPVGIGEAIEKVGKLRRMLRKVAPGPEEGPKRMSW